jgi:hypothetical protein
MGRVRPHLIVLDHSFSSEELRKFIANMRQRPESTLFVCLEPGVMQPGTLLNLCAAQLTRDAEGISAKPEKDEAIDDLKAYSSDL